MTTTRISLRARPYTFLATLLLIVLLAACGQKAAPTPPPAVQPTQPSVARATAVPEQPTRPPAPATSRPATAAAAPTTAPTTQPAPTARLAARFASPDELDSYRMKMTMWLKGEDKNAGTVILVEWVKDPPSRHTIAGSTETITIGDTTWIKVAGQWIQEQSPSLGQPAAGPEQGSQVSDEIIRQLEQNSTYKETGRDTVGGIPCKLYTYTGEITVSGMEGMQGEGTARGTGEVCVADRPDLPQVVIRSRGESSITMQMALEPDMPAREVTLEMLSETELYDINTAITIEPPTEVMTIPTAPAGIGKITPPALPTQPTLPGLPQLTPAPELKACFDSFPLPAGVKPDPDTMGAARIIAAGLGSRSEARGYVTSNPAEEVQQFIEAEALAAGWELGTMMEGQMVQYWFKDQFTVVLNIFPPSEDRQETAIALVCGMK